MRKDGSSSLQAYDPEIEKTYKRNRRAARSKSESNLDNMAENVVNRRAEVPIPVEVAAPAPDEQPRLLRDCILTNPTSIQSSIARQRVNANNFELKPSLIQMVSNKQFGGSPLEDPNKHLLTFEKLCNTVKIQGTSEDAIRLQLFPFSLRDQAEDWLEKNPPNSFTTWGDLATAFLRKYFPPAKVFKLRNEISMFVQRDGETLYEAWERFKDLQRKCPQHGQSNDALIQIFYQGMTPSIRNTIDAAAGGTLMNKTYREAYQLLEEMAANSYNWSNERYQPKRVAGVHESESMTQINEKIDTLMKMMNGTNLNQVKAVSNAAMICELCGGNDHLSRDCVVMEQSNYVGNYNRNQNNYNPGWRNHPNFSWSNPNNALNPPMMNQANPGPNQRPYQPPGFQQRNQASEPERRSNMEQMLEAIIQDNKDYRNRNDAVIKRMEMQLGQVMSQLSTRNQGSLPSTTEVNPKENCKAVMTRSGKIYVEGDPTPQGDPNLLK